MQIRSHILIILLYVFLLVPPPEITSHPMNVTVNNGSNVTFNCVSFSYAPVTPVWLKNEVILLYDDDSNFVIHSTTSDNDHNTYIITLAIFDVQLSDDGVYVCDATNREGNALSSAANLAVIGKLFQILFISLIVRPFCIFQFLL